MKMSIRKKYSKRKSPKRTPSRRSPKRTPSRRSPKRRVPSKSRRTPTRKSKRTQKRRSYKRTPKRKSKRTPKRTPKRKTKRTPSKKRATKTVTQRVPVTSYQYTNPNPVPEIPKPISTTSYPNPTPISTTSYPYPEQMVSKPVEPQMNDISDLEGYMLYYRLKNPLPGDNIIVIRKRILELALKDHNQKFLDFIAKETSDKTELYLKKLIQRGIDKGGFLPYAADSLFAVILFIFLMEKYANDCYIIQSGLRRAKFLVNREFTIYNPTLNPSYWDEEQVKRIGQSMKLCKEKGNKLMVIPLTLLSSDAHANMLIYRIDSNSVERFEPHGKSSDIEPSNKDYINVDEFVRNIIEERLTPYTGKLKYIPANETCARPSGFQGLEDNFFNFDSQKKGYCAMWSLFIMELALMNPDKTTLELQELIFKITKEEPILFSLIIVGFTSFGCDEVNKVLIKNGSRPLREDKDMDIVPTRKLTEYILGKSKVRTK